MRAPVLAGTAAHGVPGRVAGSERWIVHFDKRGFDLTAFRTAIRARRPAHEVAAIVRDLEAAVVVDQAPFVAAVAKLGGRVDQQWWLVNAAVAEIPFAQLEALRSLPNVAFVQPDEERLPAIATATNATNHAADALQAVGHVGAGVAVGIVDTGQDASMGGGPRPHRTYFVNGDVTNTTGGGLAGSRLLVNRQVGTMPPDDVHGHGTGVASIAAGANWGTAGADDGHAPRAGICGYSLANNTGGSSSLAIMATAWQQLAADRAAFNIVAANMSYTASPDPLDVCSQAIDAAALNADVMACVAAANTGTSTVVSPGATNNLAVAAVNPNAHTVAAFSSRGPLQGDTQRFYPDIAGCGVGTVMAARDAEANNYTDSGTSMASPQVAGAATQLRARFPAMTAMECKAVLLGSCRDLATQNPGLDRNAFGMGLLRNDRAHTLAAAGQFGSAAVTTAAPVHTFAIPVQAGRSYQIAITWYRQSTASTTWSNLDLAVLDPAAVVLQQSATPRNVYEVVRVFVPFTGNLTVRTTATAFGGTTNEPFAWAWMEGPAVPVPGSAATYGTACAPLCLSVNGDGGTLAPLTHAFETAYDQPASPGMALASFEVFAQSTTGSNASVLAVLYGNTGGVINTSPVAVTTVVVGPTPGFYRGVFAGLPNVPAGPFWISLDHRNLATNLSNLTAGTSSGAFQRAAFLTGPWARSALVLRPAFRLQCQTPAMGGLPLLAVPGTPTIGTTIAFNLTRGPANGAAFLALGLSNTNSPFGPLPLALAGSGAPGCTLLTSADSAELRLVDGVGAASGSLVVPNVTALVAARVFAQYACVVPGANTLGMTFSNGMNVLIGN